MVSLITKIRHLKWNNLLNNKWISRLDILDLPFLALFPKSDPNVPEGINLPQNDKFWKWYIDTKYYKSIAQILSQESTNLSPETYHKNFCTTKWTTTNLSQFSTKSKSQLEAKPFRQTPEIWAATRLKLEAF